MVQLAIGAICQSFKDSCLTTAAEVHHLGNFLNIDADSQNASKFSEVLNVSNL